VTDKPPGPVYRPAVITFLDVLGFRDLVGRTDDPAEVRRVLRLLRGFASQPDPLAPEDGDADGPVDFEMTRSIAFSDSIVRIRFFDTDYPTGALFHEVIDLLHAQGELAGHDVLVRGGVTVGQVYLEGDLVFGPGFVRAYDLESQFANHPRIVIGPEAFTALRSDPRLRAGHHDLDDEIHYQRSLLRRGDDGFWFIDYLFAIRSEMDEPDNFPALVAQHRSLIITHANAAPANSRVLQKYLWLAGYLNDVTERAGLPALRIGQADIPALEELAERPIWADVEEAISVDVEDDE
jgi:hypothetical protein